MDQTQSSEKVGSPFELFMKKNALNKTAICVTRTPPISLQRFQTYLNISAPIVTGVYLTTLGPEEGKTALNKNNWGGRRKIKRKLEAYIQIRMNESDPKLIDVSEGGRQIFLYVGDIDLENYHYIVQEFH